MWGRTNQWHILSPDKPKVVNILPRDTVILPDDEMRCDVRANPLANITLKVVDKKNNKTVTSKVAPRTSSVSLKLPPYTPVGTMEIVCIAANEVDTYLQKKSKQRKVCLLSFQRHLHPTPDFFLHRYSPAKQSINFSPYIHSHPERNNRCYSLLVISILPHLQVRSLIDTLMYSAHDFVRVQFACKQNLWL